MPVAGSCQWAVFYKEGSSYWGTYPNPNTDKFWVVMQDGASLNIQTTPNPFDIQTAGCSYLARRFNRFNVRKSVSGTLRLPMWPTQAAQLIPWACTPVTVSGRLQLPSYTCDWWDGFETRRFTGLRVSQMVLESNHDSDILMGEFTLIGKKEETPGALAEPDILNDFPSEIPYTHYHSSGQIQIGGSVITGYKSVRLTVANMMHVAFLEDQWINRANITGRNVDWQIVVSKESATNRTRYTDQTKIASCLVKWNNTDLTKSITLDTKSANYIVDYGVDRGFETDQYETLNIAAHLNTAGGVYTDLAATVV